ncbi:MAG: SRPBCC domain-containing protein [Thaumarchaeota archaeon]|nr:SRPBCC domain-containing protein [Nitrososphaerota archaeon]
MPSVQASEEFQIDAPREKCWTFFSDLANVGKCIPGCESVVPIDRTTALFKIKLKVGYLSKTFELKAKVSERVEPSRIAFVAEGTDAEITGNLEISEIETRKTGAKYAIEIRPVSITGKTAVTMIGKDLVKKQASEFATCVKSKLEAMN